MGHFDKAPLVGLTGPARCGKDSVAAILEQDHGFAAFAFAGSIKAMLKACPLLRGWDALHWEGSLKDQIDPITGLSPRELMQTLGDWGRERDPELWIQALDVQYRAARQDALLGRASPLSACVLDVRFPNEAAWIRANGGRLWHISREAAPPVRAHASEAGVAFESGDARLRNDATFTELRMRVSDLVMDLRGFRGRRDAA